tara:strand:- start:125 stop:514 length:390 start_codon:yes stop_codon:yes gene_type:complete
MAKDYSALQTKAKDKIEHYGQTVDLLKESRTSASASAPWDGTETAETRVSGVYAVYVPLTGDASVREAVAALGGTVNKSMNSFLIPFVSGHDVRTFQKVVEDSKVWRINKVDVIKPGGTVLLYQVEVEG